MKIKQSVVICSFDINNSLNLGDNGPKIHGQVNKKPA